MTQVDRRLGDMIRNCREKLEITQEEMAERVQVNLTHYGNIERGVNIPSLPLFFKIAKELNFSVDSYLYSEQHTADTICASSRGRRLRWRCTTAFSIYTGCTIRRFLVLPPS